MASVHTSTDEASHSEEGRDWPFIVRVAGFHTVYVDGSFVSRKPDPGDFDAVDKLDSVFLDFSNSGAGRKSDFWGKFSQPSQKGILPLNLKRWRT